MRPSGCELLFFDHCFDFSACIWLVCNFCFFMVQSWKVELFWKSIPFLPGCPFYWHIVVCNSLSWSFQRTRFLFCSYHILFSFCHRTTIFCSSIFPFIFIISWLLHALNLFCSFSNWLRWKLILLVWVYSYFYGIFIVVTLTSMCDNLKICLSIVFSHMRFS